MKFSLIMALYILIYTPVVDVFAESPVVDNEWENVSANEGVIVFKQKVQGSELIKVKTRVIINAPIRKILSILDDAPHRHEWIPYLEESKILKVFSVTDKLEYSLFAAPWPASNRDFVYQLSLTYSDMQKTVYDMKSVDSKNMPEQEGIIRADLIESQYTLSVIDKNQTNVELVFYADPKGWLPNWIVNIIQKVLPYRMLRNLRDRAEGATQNAGSSAKNF